MKIRYLFIIVFASLVGGASAQSLGDILTKGKWSPSNSIDSVKKDDIIVWKQDTATSFGHYIFDKNYKVSKFAKCTIRNQAGMGKPIFEFEDRWIDMGKWNIQDNRIWFDFNIKRYMFQCVFADSATVSLKFKYMEFFQPGYTDHFQGKGK
jgi:hypothetical protein